MQTQRTNCRRIVLALAAACLLSTPLLAHPGSGIAVDRLGQVYFLDTGAGLWKIDAHGKLDRISETRFHWLALDPNDQFANTPLPSGSDWEIKRVGAHPTLLLASDFPIAVGQDGNLYYPSRGSGGSLRIMRMIPSGQTSELATLPATDPLQWINGITAGPGGSLYYAEDKAIRRIDAQGRVSNVAADIDLRGSPSIPGISADDRPYLRGLAVDARGVIYVAASGCGRVLKITPGGKVTTVIQIQSPWSPTAVALLGSDLYVLEYLHTEVESRREWLPRVRKISADGTATIIATIDRRG